MQHYLEMIDYVLSHGTKIPNRGDRYTLSVFNYNYVVDLVPFPILTTKYVNLDSVAAELRWFLGGSGNITDLSKTTKIWDSWADQDGNLETAYPRYWRRYPSMCTTLDPGEAWDDCNTCTNDSFDQVGYLVTALRAIKGNPADPARRRLVLTAWHPANATVSKLPPCHYTCCFYVCAGALSCHLTQRSGDLGLGIPYNLSSYALLTYILADLAGLTPGKLAHTIVDLHIYDNHIDQLTRQLTRPVLPLPTLELYATEELGDIDFTYILHGYQHAKYLKMEVTI